MREGHGADDVVVSCRMQTIYSVATGEHGTKADTGTGTETGTGHMAQGTGTGAEGKSPTMLCPDTDSWDRGRVIRRVLGVILAVSRFVCTHGGIAHTTRAENEHQPPAFARAAADVAHGTPVTLMRSPNVTLTTNARPTRGQWQ